MYVRISSNERSTAKGVLYSLRAAPSGCTCASVRPGIAVRPFKSMTCVFGPRSRARTSALAPTATMRPSLTATASTIENERSTVRILPLCRIRSASAAIRDAAENTTAATCARMRTAMTDPHVLTENVARISWRHTPMHLRVMHHDDIPAGLRLCRLADWNQIAADWRFFLASSPRGCRVAVDDMGDVVGTVATIAYGSAFSWIGMVLVDPEHRRAGIGTRLLHEALALLGDETTARLDATPAGRHVYVPLGFCDEYELQRMVRLKPDLPQWLEATADHRSRDAGDQVDSLRPLYDVEFAEIAARE